MSAEPVDTDTHEDETQEPAHTDEIAAVTVGEYTWTQFLREHGYAQDISVLSAARKSNKGIRRFLPIGNGHRSIPPDVWDRTAFDPSEYLGFPPELFADRLAYMAHVASRFDRQFRWWIQETPARVGAYTWEHFKWEHYYEDGHPPVDEHGDVIPFDPAEHLGFDPAELESVLETAASNAHELLKIEAERTVNVNPNLDEDAFFSTADGRTTLVNRYDLEKAVPLEKKGHFFEEDRYWVDKPVSFAIIFHSIKENEKKYYVVEPYLNEIEADLIEFFSGKLRTSIKYSDDDVVIRGTDDDRAELLEEETAWLIDRYNLRAPSDEETTGNRFDPRSRLEGLLDPERLQSVGRSFGIEIDEHDTNADSDEQDVESAQPRELEGIEARPEPAVLADDPGWLTEYQIEKVLHRIQRDFIGYGAIDPIKHDINVEDISCDGYNSPVFVYHTDYENVITNVGHGESRLDSFVIKLAQRSGKGISKRQPQVDATLPDGSRAQLTLGREVSDHGTNYTIRQFKDVPFTPIDLINWGTFSLDEMAFLWLCIESHKSLIFSGGTASGKTTSLNAVSLFIPSNTKIVSIEDTREVELPQRNWVASVTRPSFTQDNTGEVDEFDLLEAALRQRPDFIVMGEVRGEEGRTLFQVMSTGHTTYTTFHADTVDEVLKRFTTDPINVSKTLFTALDLISVQTQTRVNGQKVRRNKTITEINAYDAENDEIRVQDIYQWHPDTDEFHHHGNSKKLEEIAFDRGWSRERLEEERFTRRAVLAYLITNGLNTYTEVAATIQAFINDPETILTLIANDRLVESLVDLREMESVLIDVDPHQEALVPRPEPDEQLREEAETILDVADDRLFEQYRGRESGSLVDALPDAADVGEMTAVGGGDQQVLAAVSPDIAGHAGPPHAVADTDTRSEEPADTADDAPNPTNETTTE